MTRINCIPVKELYDQHLLAEYREITRVSNFARKLEDYGEYTMGTGHVKFFYNKGEYLANRTEELYDECKKRGFNVKYKLYRPHPDGLNEDWEPRSRDMYVNVQRIREKVDAKPGFYTNKNDKHASRNSKQYNYRNKND